MFDADVRARHTKRDRKRGRLPVQQGHRFVVDFKHFISDGGALFRLAPGLTPCVTAAGTRPLREEAVISIQEDGADTLRR